MIHLTEKTTNFSYTRTLRESVVNAIDGGTPFRPFKLWFSKLVDTEEPPNSLNSNSAPLLSASRFMSCIPSLTFPSSSSASPNSKASSWSIPRNRSILGYTSQSVNKHTARVTRGAYTVKDVPKNGIVDMSLMISLNAQWVISNLSLWMKEKM